MKKGTLHEECRMKDVEDGPDLYIRHPTSCIQAVFFISLPVSVV